MKITPPPLIAEFIAIGIFMSAHTTQGNELNFNASLTPLVIETTGRDFRGFSIHPNSEDWLFIECSRDLDPEGDCYILSINIKTNKLSRYVLPEGYLCNNANYSPKGNYIVFDRIEKHDGSKDQFELSANSGQIVMIRHNGKGLSVLPIPKGRNAGPIMSADESKVAYWRRTRIGNSNQVGNWFDGEIYEYNLETSKSRLFSGPFHFFDGVMSRYTSNDEILLQSYATRQTQSIPHYKKKFNNSEVYVIRRGSNIFPEPSQTDIESAKNPSIDESGNVYVSGQQMPKPGASFFRKTPSGEKKLWKIPIELGRGGFRNVIAAPNGTYIGFIYAAEGSGIRDRRNAFGLLYTSSDTWFSVTIPPLSSSAPVHIEDTSK